MTTTRLHVASLVPSSTQKALRFAVIGGGHLGRIHAKLLAAREDVEFVAVCDPSPDARIEVESKLSLPTRPDYQSLSNQVDGVVIASPTILHYAIGRWCLEHGIHVLMEKPIAATVREADELVACAERNNLRVQVGHIERFNSAWICASQILNRESIQHIDARREGVYTGRSTDIGIVLDLMIHDIDLILSLIPEPLDSIRAYGRCVLGEHEDFAIADLVFRNGATAHLRASRISPSLNRSMEIHSSDAWLDIDFTTAQCSWTRPTEAVASGALKADTLPAAERLKVKDEMFERWLTKTELTPDAANAMMIEQSDFIESIRSGRSPIVSGRDGARALRVACEIADQIVSQSHAAGGVIPASRLAAARRRAAG
jgi:predicted dehydrogenase